MNPKPRTEQLLTQEVGDELVVYDERTHEAHRLNRTAASVWRLADGHRSVGELASRLHETIGVPADDGLVRLALAELDRVGLLTTRLPDTQDILSRREMLKVAAYLVPVVASILAPTPAMAATPGWVAQPCASGAGTYVAKGTASSEGPGCALKMPGGSIIVTCMGSTFTFQVFDDNNPPSPITYTATYYGFRGFEGTGVSGSISGISLNITINVTVNGVVCTRSYSATRM